MRRRSREMWVCRTRRVALVLGLVLAAVSCASPAAGGRTERGAGTCYPAGACEDADRLFRAIIGGGVAELAFAGGGDFAEQRTAR